MTVAAMPAGTLAVARAMFLSSHDLGVVMLVCAVAGRRLARRGAAARPPVVAGSRALRRAAAGVGDGDAFAAPAGAADRRTRRAGRELAATSAKLAASRERERALEHSRRELVAWISHDLRTPLAGLRAMAEALEDGVAEDPARYHRQIRTEVDRLSGMVDDLFELSRIQAGALALTLPGCPSTTWSATRSPAPSRWPASTASGWSATASTRCRSRSTAAR